MKMRHETTLHSKPRLLLDGLVFPEGPRWHDGKLWLADVQARRVLAVRLNGSYEVIQVFGDDSPSGLGFLPDGTPLVVSQHKRHVMRIDKDGLRLHADLSSIPGDRLNDMAVDALGRAYVGNIVPLGNVSEIVPVEQERRDDGLIPVNLDGSCKLVAKPLIGVNGTVITPDQKTLIVAETRAHRLTAFDIEGDGTLSNRRLYAETDSGFPDGIALDVEGAIWLGSPHSFEFLRVRKGGGVTDRIQLPKNTWGVACALGGADYRTLFLC